jgi:Double-GTPase 1
MNPCIVVIGVPDSGKSSFIAALSHILEFKEIETDLTLVRMPDDAKYLHEMRSDWETCKPFERTKAGVHAIIFNLINKEGQEVDLSFPDIAGEEFDKQWSSRIWNEEFLDTIEGAAGIFLFLNVKTFRKPYSMVDEDKLQRAALEAAGEDRIEDEPKKVNKIAQEIIDPGAAIAKFVSSQSSENTPMEPSDPTIWKPEKADEQAKLVDILQAIAEYAPDRRWRLGIVVSAWEIIHNSTPNVIPKAWLERNAPLLRQYLESNPESFYFCVFGVSAQGGDPEKEADELQTIETPSERVLVVTNDYQGHDLTRLVTWMMMKHD